MGQAESSNHVPNPLEEWKTRLRVQHLQTTDIVGATSWKMNAIAVLPKPPYTLYAANGAKLYVYDTQSNAEVLVRLAVKKISNLEDDAINQLRILNIAGILRLVAVCDSGTVCLWDPEDIASKPMKLMNDEVSSWSLAASQTAPLLFVGSNGHNVAEWNLAHDRPQTTRVVPVQHNHNVPCIDVSGDFLASTSIDATLRLTHIPSRRTLASTRLPQWGWGCLFVPKSQVLLYKPCDQIEWLTQVFPHDSHVPSLESVDHTHYDIFLSATQPEKPPSSSSKLKSTLNIGDAHVENVVQMEIIDEDDGEELEEDDEIDVQENGFALAEEEEEEENAHQNRPLLAHHMELSETGSSDDEADESSNPFREMHPLKRSAEQQGIEKGDVDGLSDYVVLGATFDELYLFDYHLTLLSKITRPVSRQGGTSTVLNMVERFFMLLWLPEWSMAIAANQGTVSLVLCTVRYNILRCQYELIPELTLPRPEESGDDDFHAPLSGVSAVRVNDADFETSGSFCYRLYLHVGKLLVYELRLADGKVIVQSSPPMSTTP